MGRDVNRENKCVCVFVCACVPEKWSQNSVVKWIMEEQGLSKHHPPFFELESDLLSVCYVHHGVSSFWSLGFMLLSLL